VHCFVTNNSKKKLYLSSSTGTGSCSPVSTGYVAIDSRDKKAATALSTEIYIYYCGSDECKLYTSQYHIHEFTGTKKILKYDSDNDNWTILSTYTIGYYLSGEPTGTKYPSLIYADHATNPTFPTVTINAGYYISGDSTSYKLIKCTDTNGTKACEGDTSTARITATKYYMDTVNASNNKIITCDATNGCSSGVALKGYYLNSGKSGSVIECNGTKCEEKDITATSCSAAGDLIKSGSTIYLCTSSTTKSTLKPTNDVFVTFEKDTSFPSSPSNAFNVKISKDGVVFLLEEATIQNCSATAEVNGDCFANNVDGQHCITSSGLLLKYDSSVATTCAKAVASAKSVYLDKDYKDVTSMSTGGKKAEYGYNCDAGSNCKVIKGYQAIGTVNVKCSGWKGDPCVSTAKGTTASCTSSLKDGTLLDAGTHLCFGTTTGYELPSSGTKTIVFQSKDLSSNYGANKDEIVVLTTSKTQAIVTEIEGGRVYRII